MWFNTLTKRWTTKRELAGAQPTSGPHPLIGKTFKLDESDPFNDTRCRILDIRSNSKGVEYVKYGYLRNDGVDLISKEVYMTKELDYFKTLWKEIEE